MDEREAIRRLKAGDIKGLAILVRQYQVRGIRTAYLIVRDQAQAEDIVQNVFLRVFHRISTFDENRPFAPWFSRIVVNESLNAVSRKREVSLDAPLGDSDAAIGDLLADDDPLPPEAFEHAQMRQTLWEALEQLTPDQRAVVTLFYYLDYSEREIAETLDCPRGTVKWRLHEARKRLRGFLRHEMGAKHDGR